MDQFTPLQLSLQPFGLSSNWTSKREIKHKPEHKQGGEAAAELLPNESHATANISLLVHKQKLPTATLMNKYWQV